MRTPLFALCCLTLSLSAIAAEQPKGTRITLSAQSETQLANDEVVVHFRVEARGQNPKRLQQEVNRISQAIKQRLNKEKIKLQTLGRRMEPLWDYKIRKRTGWRLSQTSRVIGRDLDAVPGWLEAIEAMGAHPQGVQFRISRMSLRKAQGVLRLRAIRAFREKAAQIASALSATGFRIIRLQTQGSRPAYPMQARRHAPAMAEAKTVRPGLSAGESRVSVTISGEIEIPFKDFQAK